MAFIELILLKEISIVKENILTNKVSSFSLSLKTSLVLLSLYTFTLILFFPKWTLLQFSYYQATQRTRYVLHIKEPGFKIKFHSTYLFWV